MQNIKLTTKSKQTKKYYNNKNTTTISYVYCMYILYMYYVCSIYRIAIYVGILCMNTTMKTKLYISLYVYIYKIYVYTN